MSDEEKKPEVNSKRIIAALKNWSPHGLCGGTLVQKNGDPRRTEACSIGCLSLEFAKSDEGRSFFRKNNQSMREFIEEYLYDQASLSDGDSFDAEVDNFDAMFTQAMNKYFGINDAIAGQIMAYNDKCIDRSGVADEVQSKLIPKKVRDTIFSLRKRFVKYATKIEKLKNIDEDDWTQETFKYPGK